MSIFDNIDTSTLTDDEKDALWLFRKLRDIYNNAQEHEKEEAKRKMEEAEQALSFLNIS